MLKQSRNAFAMQFDSRKSTAFLIAFNLQKVFHLCRAINTTTPAAALDISLHGDSDRLKEIQGSKTKVIIHLQNRLMEIEGLNTYQLSQRVNKWRQNSTAIWIMQRQEMDIWHICLPGLNPDIITLSLEPQMKYLRQCQEKSSAVSLKVLGCTKLGIPHQGVELQKMDCSITNQLPPAFKKTHHNSEANQGTARVHLLSCTMGAISCSHKLISSP